MIEWLRPSSAKRFAFFLFFDIILSLCTLYAAYLLRFNFNIPSEFLPPFFSVAFTLITLKIFWIHKFKNYTIVWRFYALTEAKNLFFALIIAYGMLALIHTLLPNLFYPFPRSVIIIDLFLSFVFLGGLRLIKRLMFGFGLHYNDLKRTLFIGISPNTANLIKSALEGSREYYPVGIIAVQEKNYNMIGSYLNNIKISGMEEVHNLVESKNITAAIIDGSLSNEYLREAYQRLSDAGIREIKRTRLLDESVNKIEELSIEELLARHPKDLDTHTIETFIHGKTVLITGAGGSIGSEIAIQCHQFNALRLILLDHSEYNLYQIGEKVPSAELYLCNIIDRDTLDTIIEKTQPDIVIHAAAYKHVPLCEANVQTAIMNNVIGSRNVIDSAIAHNVPKIVIISTDKAVRPTNVMGTTKRIVELYAQNVPPQNSEIVAVRFGNVLGSSGSVIPKFKSQIEAGGPITLTHPDITRYFMLISEACQLVLQAAAIARGGELFILDMGESVKIADLAQTMIRLYASQPIDIVYTGLRPGEKLYEELLIDESEQKTAFESIMIARSSPYPIEILKNDIEKLLESDNAIDALQKIVPEFKPSGT
ncbi:nucleoside-diphosphate sugar epimerase/dehydratase [Sulfuricurvum sp. RIFCSPLOWO2_12_FULL_43_24]|uniref:UDP-N-acetylglucosamine 4,6-dehydratase family protein n=1 Tax=Sulfuricurvum sp. RIFCSPLOWO2_12_FULL_43_24 TaxID=1802247 RepID=UPI0008B04BBE|nr:nucleoside-diphosphate sugar epimerase/dehydratase [Sulfuricurvum sp. RIFCSPLOWO2_12_FULL_43_24]OHD89364.1 MAG: UDP-N-acetylglucosamine 4,6-dehydratase [Sulfuricurvum sp. RIFCSPLOWO2_12_FULL_43_24]